MNQSLLAIMLAALIFASGCATMLLQNAANQGQELTPEQIAAYDKVGFNVISCFVFAGPPPAGKYIKVLLPKSAPVNMKFGDNCQVLQ